MAAVGASVRRGSYASRADGVSRTRRKTCNTATPHGAHTANRHSIAAFSTRRCDRRYWLAGVALPIALLGASGLIDAAQAQSCTISTGSRGDYVTQTGGACTITPGTSLGSSPPPAQTSITADASQITANGVTASIPNGQGTGALAVNGGVIIFGIDPTFGGSTLNLGTVGVREFPPTQKQGLIADGAGSQIIANGLSVNISASGNNAGALATNGGTITLNNSALTFDSGGGSNTGLWAIGAGSQIFTNNTNVTLAVTGGSGGGDIGAHADTGGAISLSGGAVTVIGGSGGGGAPTGLAATDAGSSIVGTGVIVNVSGSSNARGGFLEDGATISLTGGSVTTTGDSGSYGFLFQAPGGVTNALSLNGTTVSAAMDAFAVQGGIATIDTVGATAIGNNGILMSVVQSAAVTMTNSGSTLTGAILTDGTSTSNVTFSNGTVWNMTGSSNATNVTNNLSTIIVSPPTGDPTSLASYKTLTVTNYTGTRGNITLNTYLGNDTSPSDRLIVSGGTAIGATILTIRNTIGPGDMTLQNGIQVVAAVNGGTTAPGAFALSGTPRAGAFYYRLFRGGINGSAPDDWFLRSSFAVLPPIGIRPPIGVVPPIGVIPPFGGIQPPIGLLPGGVVPPIGTVPPIVVLPPAPPPEVLPPGTWPIIGDEVASYSMVQPIARQLGLTTLGTLNQRIGDTLALAGTNANRTGWTQSTWTRFFGQQVNNRYESFADPRANGWLGGVQAGFDLWRNSSLSGHRDAAGVYLAYSRANASIDGLVTNAEATGYVLQRTGALNLDAYSIGGYWTHYGPTGWYFDTVMQGTLYRGDVSAGSLSLPTRGTGFIASFEAGYPIPLPLGPGFVLEPQVQIILQRVAFSDASDGLGTVALGSTWDPTGRLGLRGRWTIVSDNGTVWQPYTGVNLWRDWGAQSTTVFSGSGFVPLIQQATRLEAIGGMTARLNNRLSLYGEASYQFGFDETKRREGVKGDIGVRYTW